MNEKVIINFLIDKEKRKEFKKFLIDKDTTVSKFLTAYIDKTLATKNKK